VRRGPQRTDWERQNVSMNSDYQRRQRYALVVVAVTFLSLLVAAGVRSTPGVLMVPWEKAFGWERSTISFAAGLGIFLYGLMGPFAAALMQSFGVRRTLASALALLSFSALLSLLMREPWQLVATWGVLSGLGSGCVAMVLAATIVNRWFVTNRGLVMGVLSASTATGTLIFLPALAALAQAGGWKPVVVAIAAATALLVPLVLMLVPERPADVGAAPFGAVEGAHIGEPNRAGNPLWSALTTLWMAAHYRNFWLLFATFFICGVTTNGLIGTHLIAMCSDYSIPAVNAASLMALMGLFDLAGTTASGWLTDRVDSRWLLFCYYALRGLSLIYLPFSDFTFFGLSLFAVFYGLDWIATVPPTLRLTNLTFGDRAAPVVFGWIMAGHQLGAATAAFVGGVMRTQLGSYFEAILIAGATALLASVLSLWIGGHTVDGELKSAPAT
jgi:predicted MFS family arabinose efflux permease